MSALGIKGGREVGMEGARSKVGEGAPLGVERECGQCGIGSGGIGSSGIRQQRYPHSGIAGLVFGETQNWFLMCAYGDPCVDIPVRWVLISRCCLLLEKNVVCMVVCSRFGNVSTVLRQVRFRLRDVRPSRQPAHGPSTRFLVRWPMSSASLRGAHSPQLATRDPSAGRLTLRPHDL